MSDPILIVGGGPAALAAARGYRDAGGVAHVDAKLHVDECEEMAQIGVKPLYIGSACAFLWAKNFCGTVLT